MEKLIYADASPAPTSRDEAAPEVASAKDKSSTGRKRG